MIRRAAYRPPNSGTVASGYDPTLVQDKFRTLKDGSVVPIESPKADPDLGYTFLEVKETDLPDLHNALQWFTGQSEIPIPAVLSREKGVVRIKVRGDFTPVLGIDDLSEIVADYRLLASKFGSWAEVLKRPKESEALEVLVLALAQASKAIENGLLWALRTLQIRSQTRR